MFGNNKKPETFPDRCPCGSRAVADGLCVDCLDVPNPTCGGCGYRHKEGRCPR